jgi:hypothetical protein
MQPVLSGKKYTLVYIPPVLSGEKIKVNKHMPGAEKYSF